MGKVCTRCKAELPLSAFGVNRSTRDGLTRDCKPCRNAANAKFDHKAYYRQNKDAFIARASSWENEHREQVRDRQAKYRLENREVVRAAARKWHAENKDKRNKCVAEYAKANPDRIKEKNRLWLARNLDKHAARQARRRALKRKACPAWANQFFIEQAYEIARLRTESTGFEWHVDHIVPLVSDIVCGLHVEHNLRVIPGVINLSKSNRYWPQMPDAAAPASRRNFLTT
jgi:hypothetical protein